MTILLVIIYFSFISLGLPDSLLGAVWPVLQPEFGVPIPFGGYVGMLTALSTVVSSLLAQKFHKWFGTAKIIAVSTALTAVSILGYSLVPRFWMLLPLAVTLGLGGGAIDSALNNYVAIHYKASHMSFLHCCWGLGATLGPLVLSYSMQHATWRTGYRIIALMQAILAAVQFASIPLWRGRDDGESAEEGDVFLPTVHPKTRIFALLSFFCYCAYETSCIIWVATYFVQVLHTSEQMGARASSAFFVGITLGRFLSGFVSEKIGVKRMIFIGAILAGISSAGFLLCRNVAAVYAFVFLVGFGCAPIYPSMIHRTPRRFGSKLSPEIIGQQMACAYVGSTLIPPLFGNIAAHVGFTVIPAAGIVLTALIVVFTLIIECSHVPGAVQNSEKNIDENEKTR